VRGRKIIGSREERVRCVNLTQTFCIGAAKAEKKMGPWLVMPITCPILPPSSHLHRNLCHLVIANDANVIAKVKPPQSFLHPWINHTPNLIPNNFFYV